MNFRTEIAIEKSRYGISHFDKVLLCGSCFSENIGVKLHQGGFDVLHNPMGILYNPSSVAISLGQLIDSEPFVEDDLYLNNGLWHTFSHHGKFSHPDKFSLLETLNFQLFKAHDFLKKTKVLMVTFGTSWVYQHAELGTVVANCHKYHESKFVRRRLPVDEIVSQWNRLIQRLKEINQSIELLFTVSPVRHWKDGANGNQISKSILHLAVEELCTQHSNCSYFPAYELVIDDLRDYRFFKEDMLHPNSVAVDYVWDKFRGSFFNAATVATIIKVKKIKQSAAHRPLHPDDKAFKVFAQKQLLAIDDLVNQNPQISLIDERRYFEAIVHK